jgi:hypothetical protein
MAVAIIVMIMAMTMPMIVIVVVKTAVIQKVVDNSRSGCRIDVRREKMVQFCPVEIIRRHECPLNHSPNNLSDQLRKKCNDKPGSLLRRQLGRNSARESMSAQGNDGCVDDIQLRRTKYQTETSIENWATIKFQR